VVSATDDQFRLALKNHAAQTDTPRMSRPSVRLMLVLTLVMAISGAAGAFAAGGRFTATVALGEPDPTCVVDESGECVPVDDEDAGAGNEDTDAGKDEPTPEEREAECDAAAGYGDDDGEGTVDGETTDGEPLRGLDKAIEQVYANCLKNPTAPGLVNALERLRANAERKAAQEAEREARAAERAAERAEREAEREARQSEHGNAGGNAGGNGTGNAGGNGNGNGHGGNPHA
jgi:hypothetical protein